jgi:hypothetical protein
VVARSGHAMGEVARQVRAALAALIPGSPVDVIIDDLEVEPPPIDAVDVVVVDVVVDTGPLPGTSGLP